MNLTRPFLSLSFGALLLAVMLAGGCSKEQPAARANPGSNAPGTPGAPAAGVADSGDISATLSQLSLELRKYVVRTRSVPKNFEEFVAKSQVQVPAPPPGKKYAIQDQEVVLVKR
jgi:hypothetical protein